VLASFISHIEKLCKTTDKILLAVSGGMDSMTMLHLFHQAGFSFSVAHGNFQLRGQESEEDERFVAAWCQKLNCSFHSIRFDTNNYAIEKGLSIQMAARELRYIWFERIRKTEKIDWIATAHHLNDSVETVLLNFTKGASLEGLLGIPEKNNRIIRPLLFATQDDIQNYAASNGIRWREDESNQKANYQRNLVRHHVVPKLKELNPAFERSVENTLQKLRGTDMIVSHALEDWKKRFLATDNENILLAKAGFEYFDGDGYATAILWELLRDFDFHYDQCESISTGMHGQSGKRFLSGTHQLIIDRENLVLVRQQENWKAVTVESGQNQVCLGNSKIRLQSTVYKGISGTSKNEATFDEGLIHFPLTWRKWNAGDFFFPLGMKNRKKISDFLIDEKVSLADKDQVTVLESRGEIIWLVGHRIDDRFKVTENTKRVITISFGSAEK
jgi:tRNA(Ile)-lysidine synthase